MKLDNNTIFITGGASGIGRALAESLHKAGSRVIIASRRKELLDAVTAANPGMESVILDVSTAEGVHAAVTEAIDRFPEINVAINNAGIMQSDIVATNFLGPVRVTSGFIEHLKTKKDAAVIHVTSVLGFVPLAPTAIYSATKAAMHSFAMSQRFMLQGSGVRVLEIAPPWVQTELLNSSEEPRAMPLAPFIEQAMVELATDADEILVGQAPFLRSQPGPNEMAFVTEFNKAFVEG